MSPPDGQKGYVQARLVLPLTVLYSLCTAAATLIFGTLIHPTRMGTWMLAFSSMSCPMGSLVV
jgi:hypothetical protein